MGRTHAFWIQAAALLWVSLGAASAQNLCYFYLLNHVDSLTNTGVAIDLERDSAPGPCQLSSVKLVLVIGDGHTIGYAVATPKWQLGQAYTATAVIAPGSQQLFLDGQMVATSKAGFQPMQGQLQASQIPSWANAPAAYAINQTGLRIANGARTLALPPHGYVAPPIPNILMGGPPNWAASFTEDPTQTLTVTATFQFTAALDDPQQQYDPYIDPYGQSNYGSWRSKVTSDSDLQAAIVTEQGWLSKHPPPAGLDIFGGSTVAGWQDVATGYYHTAFSYGRWWLISPLGNPAFYISIAAVPGPNTPTQSSPTPITGREAEFAGLPSRAGPFAPSFGTNYWADSLDANTTFFYFDVANLMRKYGSRWASAQSGMAVTRLSSWGFQGMGKWSGFEPGLTVPSTPVLQHGAVPNTVPGGHPDIFDASVVAQLMDALASQIGSHNTDPYIVGWSVGSELSENIQPSEVQAMLALDASTPAKQALVNQALTVLYGGNLRALASAWKIAAATVDDAYEAAPKPPANDIEALRQFFEQNYYQTLYATVKSIDPNHLYLGNWINPPDDWVNLSDWVLIARNCDVIGFDYYASQFHTAALDALIGATNMPVLVGEFSFPPNYEGQRGFGSYEQVLAESDSGAGDLYAQWLRDTSADPYVVGVSWYQYRDEPVSGRGSGSGSAGPDLVYGEDYAFGMLDIADQPKYDLVNKVRSANIAALRSLGLLGSAP